MHILENPILHTQLQSILDSKLLCLLLLIYDGSNFLEWINDARIILTAEDLARTLHPSVPSASSESEVQIPAVCKWQVLSLLRHHLDYALRLQYLENNDPADLWTQLHAHFYHQQTLCLSQARTDRINLWVLDFLDFVSFNSELHRITAQLRLCGQTSLTLS